MARAISPANNLAQFMRLQHARRSRRQRNDSSLLTPLPLKRRRRLPLAKFPIGRTKSSHSSNPLWSRIISDCRKKSAAIFMCSLKRNARVRCACAFTAGSQTGPLPGSECLIEQVPALALAVRGQRSEIALGNAADDFAVAVFDIDDVDAVFCFEAHTQAVILHAR